MNNTTSLSKITLPSNVILNCYYYFASIIFFLTCFITPISFYTILTQSKNLKNFKWFVINHFFWSFVHEIFLGLFKPVILTPATALFSLGFIRNNGSFEKTIILFVLELCAGINYNAGFVATMATRYLTTFPSHLTKWITKKLIIFVTVSVSVSVNIFTVIVLTSLLINNEKIVIKDNIFFFETLNESSLVYLPIENIYNNILIIYVITILLSISGIFGIIFFSYTVFTNKYSETTTSMLKSLIISSIFQILISVIFFGFPVILICTFIIFQIEHTTEWTCLAIAIFSIHSFLESIATLYFVKPYRRFIKKKLFQFIGSRSSSSSVSTIKIYVEKRFTKIQ